MWFLTAGCYLNYWQGESFEGLHLSPTWILFPTFLCVVCRHMTELDMCHRGCRSVKKYDWQQDVGFNHLLLYRLLSEWVACIGMRERMRVRFININIWFMQEQERSVRPEMIIAKTTVQKKARWLSRKKESIASKMSTEKKENQMRPNNELVVTRTIRSNFQVNCGL